MRIALVNLPFAALSLPAFALTQLRSVLDSAYGDRLSVSVLYLNHDFAHFLGPELYHSLSTSLKVHATGLGDWFFRQVAFPELEDNTADYLARYYPRRDHGIATAAEALLAKRLELAPFLDRLIEQYGLEQFEVVGLTSMFAQNTACFALARRLKERHSAVVTAMGGANCEAPMGPQIAASIPAIDYVFSGPALASFPRFVGLQLAGDREGCERLQGVYTRSNCAARPWSGRDSLGEERPIDEFVPVDYRDFLERVSEAFPDGQVSPALLFETSRGCWWGARSHCTFCGLNGQTMTFRALAPETAVAQFEDLFEYYPRVRRLQCVDNIMPRSYLKEVFPHLKPPADLAIYYEVKADLKDGELETLSRAGVREIQPGIEALATETLRLMRKGTTAFQNLRFLMSCLLHRIRPDWNLLLGFPGEHEAIFEAYSESLRYLVHLPPPSGAAAVRFDRFSPYFMRSAEFGLDLEPCDYYRLTYPLGDEELRNLAYYFVDRNYEAEYRRLLGRWSDRIEQEVERWKERWRRGSRHAPRLYWRASDGAEVVFDSRGEAAVEHDLAPLAVTALRILARPLRREELAREAPASGEGALDRAITDLVARRLLFEEDGKLMSLVLACRPEGFA